MIIKKIQVKNFRLLKDFVMDLQSELSFVIGKNNVGNPSLLLVPAKLPNISNARF